MGAVLRLEDPIAAGVRQQRRPDGAPDPNMARASHGLRRKVYSRRVTVAQGSGSEEA